MHRQASFITGFFPDKGEEVARGEADAFYFPPFASGNLGNPVLGAGTLYTMAKILLRREHSLNICKKPQHTKLGCSKVYS